MMRKKFDLIKLLDKRNLLYRDLLLWTIIVFIFIVFKEYPLQYKGTEIVCFILQLTLLTAIPSYTNNLIIIPLFKKRKIAIAIISYISQIILLTLSLPVLFELISHLFVKIFDMQQWTNWKNENVAFNIIAFTVIASVFKIAKDKIILESERKETELKNLVAQLNPHFLFNTLNNLYGLAVKQSDKLPQLMLKLSAMLRYSLYDTNQDFVPLIKEIDYLKNYIELEKIRLDEKIQIEFEVKADFLEYYISPLILIVYIENSFKHLSHKKNEKGYILINLNIQNNMLDMIVKNSLDALLFADMNNKRSKGIGLMNIQKRLDIVYFKKYQLDIKHEPDHYEVHLRIDLRIT